MALGRRLHELVSRISGSTSLQEGLRREPRETLGRLGLPVPSGSGALLVPGVRAPVCIDATVLAGADTGPAAAGEPPFDARLVCYGVRPAALLHGPEAHLARTGRLLRRLALAAILSPDEYDPLPDQGKGGFANRAGRLRPARPGSGAHRRLIVATSWDGATLGWLALALGWDGLLGRFLGYPPCCVAAFEERWPEAQREHEGDLLPLLLHPRAEGAVVALGAWRSSVHARYAGPTLVPHFPCNVDCPATRAQADRAFHVLQVAEPATAVALRSRLRSPVVLGGTAGVAVLGGTTSASQTSQEVRIEYAPEEAWVSDPTTSLGQAVLSSTALRARRDRHEVAIGVGGGGLRLDALLVVTDPSSETRIRQPARASA